MKKTFDKTRPISWSFISSFEYDPEQWYQSYVLNKRSTSKEMTFGSMVDKEIEINSKYLPDVVRYPIMQHKMRAKLGKIELVGIADTYLPFKGSRYEASKLGCSPLAALRDYKTGKKPWNQKRADETGQLTMYCLLLWLTEKIRPEDVELYIDWLPTKETGDFSIQFKDRKVRPYTFKTKRTMRDVLEFCTRIERTLILAEAYCQNHADVSE